MNLSEFMKHELVDETAFSIGPIAISESTVVSWVVMAIIIALCIFLGSNLRVHNISKRQAIAELFVTKLENLILGITGPRGKPYACYLFTVLVFLSMCNIMGVFGMKPPTKSLIVPVPLAIMSLVLVQVACIRTKRVKGWLLSFRNPINILDLITRPLSLCMRLFGNILGAFVIMEILNYIFKIIVPAVFSLYFDFFDGILQAYVFTYLSCMYIKEAVEIPGEED